MQDNTAALLGLAGLQPRCFRRDWRSKRKRQGPSPQKVRPQFLPVLGTSFKVTML